MRKRFITLLGVVGILCLTLALFAPVANAAEDTDTATVLVTVTASTIAVTAPADWNFGNMGVGETAEQLDAVVNVMANTAYSLEVSGTDFAAVSFPVSYLDWKSGGGGAYADMSTVDAFVVANSGGQPASPAGDNVDFDLRLTIPSSVSGAYSSTLTFTATNL